jgi:signal transduction histidine kinase
VLDDLGLQAAIEWQIEEFQVRTDICSVAHAAIGDLQLDGELATTIFRIFQEALTNVARHADASEVQVSLVLDHGNIRLDVADDGVGIPEVGRRSDTLGLLGMRERARSLGGECTVSRRTPRGTLVRLTVPLKFPAERPAM